MDSRQSSPRLSLAAIPYLWPAQEVFDFYDMVAGSKVDIVYLGEVVCSKRRELRTDDWLQIAAQLQATGKEVVLSTLTLIESGAELGALKRHCLNGVLEVEANDVGAVEILREAEQRFVAGPGINIYNRRTLKVLHGAGMRRWVLPVELAEGTLAALSDDLPDGVETEVQVFGRMALAWSARCYTARAHNIGKDDCQFRCIDYPDGLLMRTQEEQAFLNINGIQTQSAQTLSLADRIAELLAAGTDILRLNPQSQHMLRIIEIFDQLRHSPGQDQVSTLVDELNSLLPQGPCNGYFAGEPGMVQVA